MDLWTMNPDGANQKQITFTPDWQEGGAVYLPDNKTIITRAWKKSDENLPSKPMQLFLLERGRFGHPPGHDRAGDPLVALPGPGRRPRRLRQAAAAPQLRDLPDQPEDQGGEAADL